MSTKKSTTSVQRFIFLDIDGVLATFVTIAKPVCVVRGYRFAALDPGCVGVLNRITDVANAVIVLSSTWRFGTPDRFRTLCGYLADQGVRAPIVDRTPHLVTPLGQTIRGHEIEDWRQAHGVPMGRLVILDDSDDMGRLIDRLVRPNMYLGLQPQHATQALCLLGLSPSPCNGDTLSSPYPTLSGSG